MEKTEPDPEMMQSAEEHQEISTDDAAVMPVGEPRKRRRFPESGRGAPPEKEG
jgi:hypothetical protein